MKPFDQEELLARVETHLKIGRMNRQLTESTELYKTTLMSIGDAVIVTDQHGCVTIMNSVAEKLTGWTATDAHGQQLDVVFRIISETSRIPVEDPVRKVQMTGQIVGLANHTVLIAKDGSEFPISDSGAPIRNDKGEITGVVLVFRDQSEERKVEKTLLQSEHKYLDLYEHAPDMYISIDPSTGNVIDCNQNVIDNLGFTREEMLNRKLIDLYHPDCHEDVKRNLRSFLEKGEVRDSEMRVLRKDGTFIEVSLNASAVRDEQGAIRYSRSIWRDNTRRKKAERLLEESEERFRLLFEKAPVGYQSLDEDGNFLEVNQTWLDILGYQRVEVIGKWFGDFLASEFKEAFRERFPIFKKQGSIHSEFEMLHKEGACKYISFEGRIGYDDQNRFKQTHCVLQDITLNKQAEREVDRLLKMLQLSTNEIYMFDATTLRFHYVNQGALNNLGYSAGEIALLTPLDIKPDFTADLFAKLVAPLHSGEKEQLIFETRHLRKDGTTYHVEVHLQLFPYGREQFFLAIILDITERKNADSRIRQLLRGIEQSHAIVVITDLTGVIEYVNPKFAEVTGYTANEAIGKKPNILNSGIQSADFYQELWRTIKSGKDWTGEFRNRRKNGDLYWESAIISPILDEMGQVTHFIAIKEDVTDKKQMIVDLVLAKEQAVESDKLKTAFLNNISHEVRTPLNAIVGFSGLLTDENTVNDQERYIRIINDNADQLLHVIDDVLEFSRLESETMTVEMDEFSILLMLTEIEQTMRHFAKAKRLEFRIYTGNSHLPDRYLGDRAKIKQIITCLISNAIKYTTNGSVEFGYDIDNGNIRFFVRDTGIGVAEKELDRIFDRFYRAQDAQKRAIRGTGLGLSIARDLVSLMHGQIAVISAPDKGSEFYFTLPLVEVEQAKDTVKPVSKHPDLSRFTIIIAEDESDNFEFMKILLGKRVKALHRAEDGTALLDLLKSVTPDLILMDLKMPIMDGYEATRRVKALFPLLPVIALTAYSQPDEKKLALAAGCYDFISKPVRPETILAAINKTLLRNVS